VKRTRTAVGPLHGCSTQVWDVPAATCDHTGAVLIVLGETGLIDKPDGMKEAARLQRSRRLKLELRFLSDAKGTAISGSKETGRRGRS